MTSNGAFRVSYGESRLFCKFELNTASLDFNLFQATKNQNFHNSSRRPQMLRFVLVTVRKGYSANVSFIGEFRFLAISGHEKFEFSQLVPESFNGAFCGSYGESRLFCKFELNTSSLVFNQVQVTKKPNFHNLSKRTQMVQFVLVMVRDLSSIRRVWILSSLRSQKIRFFVT